MELRKDKNNFFKSSVRLTGKLRRRYRDYPAPMHACIAFPSINIRHQRWGYRLKECNLLQLMDLYLHIMITQSP